MFAFNFFPAMKKHLLLLLLLLCCLTKQNATAQTTPDPGVPGTHAVVKGEYNLGDLAWKPPGFPDSVEVRGSVHYPADLSSGPFPVLFFLHGRHDCCYDTTDPTNTNSDWPCTGTYKAITSYEGYDYLANTMASHGYIVVSVSCNAINAADDTVADYGMSGRGQLLQHHMDLWNSYNTSAGGPFDSLFIGKLDMQRVGTMGHSRGGEGVIFNALYNQSLGSPYGIKAVITLAPVDFLRHVMHGTPLLNVAPYCDGDVNDIQGVHFYDDSRYTDSTDEAPKHSVLMLGANHNYFNTVWTPGSYIAGGVDDWLYYFSNSDPHCGESASTRFDTTTQKAAFNAYAAAFYRIYIGHETQFSPILDVNDIAPPLSSLLDSSNVFVSYQPAKSDRRDINRTDSLYTDTLNSLGGRVTDSGISATAICGGGLAEPDCGITVNAAQKPHDGSIYTMGVSQMKMSWADTTSWYLNEIPHTSQDASAFENIIFRAAVNFNTSPFNTPLDFTVQLIDSEGVVSNAVISHFSNSLFFQQGIEPGDLPKVLLNTISLPLTAFTGVNKQKLRFVKFLFNKNASGSFVFSDLAFSSPLCGSTRATYFANIFSRYNVSLINQTVANNGDSLTYLWNFGEPASGVRDTSTYRSPTHVFSAPGTYQICLSTKAYRENGLVCTDTVCGFVILTNDAVLQVNQKDITIYPNPASNFLRIDDAEPTDLFRLINLLGQEMFHCVISDPSISLPVTIPTGVYYVEVATKNGKFYQKIVINR